MKKKNKKAVKNAKLTSSLKQHKRTNKTLMPPMMHLPIGNLNLASWMNNRLPEMLWACLVISVLPRNDALIIFKNIAALGFKYRDTTQDSRIQDLTHSSLANFPDDLFSKIIHEITKHPLGYAALRPLLLLDSLPDKKRWESALLWVKVDTHDWQTLAQAVGNTLDHQSEKATDVRWLTILFKIALDQIRFAPDMAEKRKCIINYPNEGEMRSVRPSIRAIEMSFQISAVETSWPKSFWLECLKKTDCLPGKSSRDSLLTIEQEKIASSLHEVQWALLNHWSETILTTYVDARHDTVFGFGFYALALLLELLIGKNRQGIVGRLVLKTLVDCRISLAYLLFENDAELWLKFRNFGTGQAKLALLKLDEFENIPSFINADLLEQLANEDLHQEFVNINLGHWCDQDLRKMADASGTKTDYDKYYSWSSTYSHAQWAALRDVCLTTCFNPLHRLHRIPRLAHRFMEDVMPDAIYLVDAILTDVGKAYPGFTDTITQKLHITMKQPI